MNLSFSAKCYIDVNQILGTMPVNIFVKNVNGGFISFTKTHD